MPLTFFSKTKTAILAALAGAIIVGVIYELPHVLIARRVHEAGRAYLPVTIASDFDEAQIYAPQIEDAADGALAAHDPAIREHAGDPTLLAPLGPATLGTLLARPLGMARYWFATDAILPPLLFLLFFAIAWSVTRSVFTSLAAAGVIIFFREAASFLPLSTLKQAKTYVSAFLPFIPSGNYNTHLAFGRLLTPQWTFLPLALFFLCWVRTSIIPRATTTVAAGMLYGLLFYSYPYDAIAVSVILGASLLFALFARDGQIKKTSFLIIAVGLTVSLPYWLSYRELAALPHYAELLDRTGLEIGRAIRWSLVPHYLFWTALAVWLYRRRAANQLHLPAAAMALGVPLTMNTQLLTGYVPQPWHFLIYSLALPAWIAVLVAGRPLAARFPKTLKLAGILALAVVLVRNAQIPFGYARQQWERYAVPPAVARSYDWMRTNVPRNSVLLSPLISTNTHALIYTPAKVFFPPTGVVTSAGNRELVERFVVAAKLFGASDDAVQNAFADDAAPAILHYGLYATEPDQPEIGVVRRPRPDMDILLAAALARWHEDLGGLLRQYSFEYVFVGPDERARYRFDPSAFPRCLTSVWSEADVTIYRVCETV